MRRNIIFYLASDTLVYLAKKVIDNLSLNFNVIVVIPKFFNENAGKAMKLVLPNIECRYLSYFEIVRLKPIAVVFGNDWGTEAKLIVSVCRWNNIVTYCIQESIVDFNDESGKMQYSDYVFIQGKETYKYLVRQGLLLTGNPRYENYCYENITLRRVMINCNFTYGIFEDKRDSWVANAVAACRKANLDFFISQHPRDGGDLSIYKNKVISSSASSVGEQLKNSSVLISRFSSLIHEAVLTGRKAIYFNPHNEKMIYDFLPDRKVVFLATNYEELLECLQLATEDKTEMSDFEKYISDHLYITDVKASKQIAEHIMEYKDRPDFPLKRINLLSCVYSYMKIIVKYFLSKIGL